MPRQNAGNRQSGRGQQQGGRTAAEAEAGSVRTLANGAQAGYFNEVDANGNPKRVWRIFQGAPASYMASGGPLQSSRKAPLSQAAAQERFDKYYARFGKNQKKHYKSKAGLHRARGLDKATTSKNINTTTGYHPRTMDYPGVDTGKARAPPSQKQLEALAAGREKRRANLQRAGNQRGSNQRGSNQRAGNQRAGERQMGGYWW